MDWWSHTWTESHILGLVVTYLDWCLHTRIDGHIQKGGLAPPCWGKVVPEQVWAWAGLRGPGKSESQYPFQTQTDQKVTKSHQVLYDDYFNALLYMQKKCL